MSCPHDSGAISERTLRLLITAAVADSALPVATLLDIERPTGKSDPGPEVGVAAVVAVVRSGGVLPISYSASRRRRQPLSDSPPRKRKVRSFGPALAAGSRQTFSLIPSLIHVRVPGSITVCCWSLSRVYRPAWPVLDGHPSS
jgi:hypothetical protein